MLRDHSKAEAKRAAEALRRRSLKDAYTEYLMYLYPWNWWGTITIRGQHRPGAIRGMAAIAKYIGDMEKAAGAPIVAAVAESYGDSKRFHAHVLIAGVEQLRIDRWRAEAVRRFGTTKLKLYDAAGHACRYFIQNAFAERGEWYLEGSLRHKTRTVL